MMKRLLYRWFSSFSAFQYRVDRRFTRAGSLALGVLGAAVVIGLDTNRTVGYQVFTLVLALVLLSAASSLVFRGRFTARRILPRYASVGVPVTYRMAITNHTRRRQDGLVLLEELTDPRPTFEEFVTAREPGEERRNWFDRQVGYPRWAWLVSQKRGAVIAPRPLPTLPAAGETEVTLEVTPLRRGHWKSWARVGRPVVKEYLDEFFVRHALILDTFTGDLGDPIFEEAVSVAASVAISMQTQESLLDLMFVGPEAYCFTAGRDV